MAPRFISDWEIGLKRFKGANAHFTEFDELGQPRFAGWIFNGFDTARERRTRKELDSDVPPKGKKLVRADAAMYERLDRAIRDDLVTVLRNNITHFDPVVSAEVIGEIEDANVLIQNSLMLNVPIAQLGMHDQVVSLYDRKKWASNQLEQIDLLKAAFDTAAKNIVNRCT